MAAMIESSASDVLHEGKCDMSLLGGLLGLGWRAAPQANAGPGQSASAPGPEGPGAGSASPEPSGAPVGGSGWPREPATVAPAATAQTAPGNGFVPRGAGSQAAGTPTDARASRHDFGAPPLNEDGARAYALAGRERERLAGLIAGLAGSGPPPENRSDPPEEPQSSRSESGPAGYADHLGALRGQGPANGRVLDRAA